jgi:hypothetical protein
MLSSMFTNLTKSGAFYTNRDAQCRIVLRPPNDACGYTCQVYISSSEISKP